MNHIKRFEENTDPVFEGLFSEEDLKNEIKGILSKYYGKEGININDLTNQVMAAIHNYSER